MRAPEADTGRRSGSWSVWRNQCRPHCECKATPQTLCWRKLQRSREQGCTGLGSGTRPAPRGAAGAHVAPERLLNLPGSDLQVCILPVPPPGTSPDTASCGLDCAARDQPTPYPTPPVYLTLQPTGTLNLLEMRLLFLFVCVL